MNRTHRSIRAAAALALLAAVSCQPDAPLGPSRPQPGALAVSLASRHADVGAVLISVRGPRVGTPFALDPAHRLFVLSEREGEFRLALLGEHLAGALIGFDVPDTRHTEAYEVTLLEVAGDDNQLREVTDGYRVNLSPLRRTGSDPATHVTDGTGATIIY